MTYIIIASFFVSVLLITYSLLKLIDERIISRRRVQFYTETNASNVEEDGVTKKKTDYKTFLKPLSSSMKKAGYSKKWEDKLRRADIPLKGEEFLAIWYIGVLLSALLIIIDIKLVMVLLFVLIYPSIYINSKITKRVKKFNAQLNDALSILANSLRAGFSFFQAMDTVRKEMPDPISKEFGKTLKEINFGTPVEEALRNMSQRTGSQDLDLVITSVLIQRQVGGNMAEILETIAQTIRDRIKILGEIQTLTAQGRISGYIIGGLPVVLLAVLSLINPEYVDILFTRKEGWAILAGGLVSEIFGLLVIKKIIAIEV